MTTVSLGFTRGDDKVGKKDSPEFSDTAKHWQYRLGLTQILTPRWIMSVNVEALSDDGFLGSPYRVARVFGAAVPERNPRTRSARAIKLRLIGDLGSRDAMHADYRYYWDTWDIKAHTAGARLQPLLRRALAGRRASCATTRRTRRCFYSDNAQSETPTSRATASSAPSTTPAIGAKVS